ncbi:MAG: hypothetical protein Q7J04_03745 [Microcella sp.]|nr:hypothetical protein [Microcella sp.]
MTITAPHPETSATRAVVSTTRRSLSGAVVLAIITSIASLLAIVSVVVMLGFLPPDELAQLGLSAP